MSRSGTTGHHGAKVKDCQRHFFYFCGVAQQCGADRAPTPGNDVVAQRNEQVVYVPDDNYRNA